MWLNATDPAADLASRIRAVAASLPSPAFVLCYGGLAWQADARSPKLDFYTLQKTALAALGDEFVPIGAQEMGRLAREAHGAR